MSKALPDKGVLATIATSCYFCGSKIIDYQNLKAFIIDKTTTSCSMSSDELKTKMFVWVYDSKSMKEIEKRRDFIKEKLDSITKGYNYYFGISDCEILYSVKGEKVICEFKGIAEYGANILIILF